jgi:hypothetical protein
MKAVDDGRMKSASELVRIHWLQGLGRDGGASEDGTGEGKKMDEKL